MFLCVSRPRLSCRSRLASTQCLQDRYLVASAHCVAQVAPVPNQRVANEDVDVRSQAAMFVAKVETDARRTRFESAYHSGHVGGFDVERLSLELRKECKQMPCELDLDHAAEVGTRSPNWQRSRIQPPMAGLTIYLECCEGLRLFRA